MVSSVGKRRIPSTVCKAGSARGKLVCAKRRAPATTESKKAVKVCTGSIALGEVREIGRCCRAASRYPIRRRNSKKQHQPAKRRHRSHRLTQFHFPPRPKER